MGHDRACPRSPTDLLELAHAYGVDDRVRRLARDARPGPGGDHRGGARRHGRRRLRPGAGAGRSGTSSAWRRMLPPCVVVVAGRAGDCCGARRRRRPGRGSGRARGRRRGARLRPGRPLGRARARSTARRIGEATFAVPADLPLGYHTLHATLRRQPRRPPPLIVTPAWLGLPERCRRTRRSWGFATQLYSVRSRRSWGVGDLADLTDLAVWSAPSLGADYVLVNPLHAAEPLAPLEPSPYLPTSRRFFNPLYLRVERIPEYADLPAAERATVDAARGRRARPGSTPPTSIDRDTAWTAKRAALRIVHAVPRSAGRELDYAAFRARQGDALRDYATWSVLAEEHGNDYRAWPADLQDVASRGGRGVRRRRTRTDVDFECWLQWVARRAARSRPRPRPWAPGWRWAPCTTSRSACTPAAPTRGGCGRRTPRGSRSARRPDPFNQIGQNWSQPPWRPDRLEELGYAAVPRPDRAPCCGTPAGSASTTSSGCSGCGGSPRAGRRPRAPTSATTTRR